MVDPSGFDRNEETATTNAFMHHVALDDDTINARATREFHAVASSLKDAGLHVIVYHDADALPDAVFPNNWFTMHAMRDGTRKLVTYPMLAASRRRERREGVFQAIDRAMAVSSPDRAMPANRHRIRLESLEHQSDYLEGTGSLVLDRLGGVAYAVRSPRTTARALEGFSKQLGYRVVAFDAASRDDRGASQPIYHTNVMMTMGETLAIWCPETVRDQSQRELVQRELAASSREIFEITLDQMNHFAGNVLQLRSAIPGPLPPRGGGDEAGGASRGRFLLAMSARAWSSFTPDQQARLQSHGQIIAPAIPTIEDVGGGGVRCMLAEVFE